MKVETSYVSLPPFAVYVCFRMHTSLHSYTVGLPQFNTCWSVGQSFEEISSISLHSSLVVQSYKVSQLVGVLSPVNRRGLHQG